MRLQASETVQRRLDAYLDAKHLHERPKNSELLYRIERMNMELWRVYRAHSIKMTDVALLSLDRQRRLALAMNKRLKRLLREKTRKEDGYEPMFNDSESYWKCKTRVLARKGIVDTRRKPGHIYWAGSEFKRAPREGS
ncbi:MAG TPA: hypothetical protein VKP13_09620 [Nitrospira sp.]|nr:hypothetical protein [Nitrospira sp.]